MINDEMEIDYTNVVNVDGTINKNVLDWTPQKKGFLEGLIDFWHFIKWPEKKYSEENRKKTQAWHDSELTKGVARLEYIPSTGRITHIGVEIPSKEERKRLINSVKSDLEGKDRWLKVLDIFDKIAEKYPNDTYHWPNSCMDADVFFRNNILVPGDTAILYGGARGLCLNMLADDLIVKGVNVAYSMDGSI